MLRLGFSQVDITLSSDVPSNEEAQRIAKEALELCGIAE